MTAKTWFAVVPSLIVLIGCAGGGGSDASTKPSIDMTSDSSAVTSGQSGSSATGMLTLNPANGAFGSVKIGVRKGITFSVSNPPANARFTATVLGPDANQFVMAGGSCFGAIRPTSTPANPCTMQVIFVPTSAGPKSASMDVTGSATARLTGTGVTN
jgi:hypothetical protein